MRSKDKFRQHTAQSRDREMVSALYSHAFRQVLSYPNNDGVGERQGMGLDKTRLLIIIHKGG